MLTLFSHSSAPLQRTFSTRLIGKSFAKTHTFDPPFGTHIWTFTFFCSEQKKKRRSVAGRFSVDENVTLQVCRTFQKSKPRKGVGGAIPSLAGLGRTQLIVELPSQKSGDFASLVHKIDKKQQNDKISKLSLTRINV